ncbi:NuoB/complex I 20 kDa subunit family protein [Embleya sp. NPDC056575]|uniref:NuoB/complex I 20 kDa subunit family protein n=1 Tax=unclassified Embleya TaxID=2699296 RepID=UPI003698C8AE
MGIEEKLPSGFLLSTVEGLAGYFRKGSFWPATFGLACCAIEMMATGAGRYDLARFGMEVFRASPRQADLMIVAGRVSQKMAPVLRQIYDQMPNPKWVLSMGVCASSGGMFNNYAIVQGVDHVVPVDIYLPGCPPRPEMLMDAIIKLREEIQAMPLGVNREKAARAAEQAAMKALPTIEMLPASARRGAHELDPGIPVGHASAQHAHAGHPHTGHTNDGGAR